eukprot:TRINITY_DN206_c0_g1_i1.p1 TRINITY_DN206_c0_g1~~TRINITY_DN206_c0_g1_i1.p1  ORF type:complete len:1032 (-),score=234.14 TRINITY_DN206_c0_g1_i1:38-2674(-)
MKHSYKEDKTGILLESEPILASLANILSGFKGIDDPPAIELDEIEMRLGLFQICEAVYFLQQNANIVHMNITPNNIYITKHGVWKLGGMEFSVQPSTVEYDWDESETNNFTVLPCLDYLAPETAYLKKAVFTSDIFSLGCVAYELHTKDKLLDCDNQIRKYKHDIGNIFPLPNLSHVPMYLRDALVVMLESDPDGRISITNFLKSDYFDNFITRTLNYLCNLLEKDLHDVSNFLKGLLTAINQFPISTLENRVLPYLLQELRNTQLIPFLLPNIFAISKELTATSFQKNVFKQLIPVFEMSEPHQVKLILMQNLPEIIEKSTGDDIIDYIIPMVIDSFHHQVPDVHVAVLNAIPTIVDKMEFDQMKDHIVPKLQEMCMTTRSTKIRIKCLQCFSELVPRFTETIMSETILPTIFRCYSGDKSPSVQIAVTGVCNAISKQFGIDITAEVLLPRLLPSLIDPAFDKSQYVYAMKSIKTMLGRIDKHRLNVYNSIPNQAEEVEVPNHQKFNILNEMVKKDFEGKKENRTDTTIPDPSPPEVSVDPQKVDEYRQMLEKQKKSLNKDQGEKDSFDFGSPKPKENGSDIFSRSSNSDIFGGVGGSTSKSPENPPTSTDFSSIFGNNTRIDNSANRTESSSNPIPSTENTTGSTVNLFDFGNANKEKSKEPIANETSNNDSFSNLLSNQSGPVDIHNPSGNDQHTSSFSDIFGNTKVVDIPTRNTTENKPQKDLFTFPNTKNEKQTRISTIKNVEDIPRSNSLGNKPLGIMGNSTKDEESTRNNSIDFSNMFSTKKSENETKSSNNTGNMATFFPMVNNNTNPGESASDNMLLFGDISTNKVPNDSLGNNRPATRTTNNPTINIRKRKTSNEPKKQIDINAFVFK